MSGPVDQGLVFHSRHKQLTITTFCHLILRLRPRPRLFMCAPNTDIK